MSGFVQDAPKGGYFWQDEAGAPRFSHQVRLGLVGLSIMGLAACEGRYAATDEGVLASRVSQDFAIGSPAAALIDALTANDYHLRGPVRTDPRALQDCLSRRVVGRLQLAGSRSIHVCFAADDFGNLTAIEVSSLRNTI